MYLVLTQRKLICKLLTEERQIFFSQDIFLIRHCKPILEETTKNSILVIKVLRFSTILGLIFWILIGLTQAYFLEYTAYPLPFPYQLPLIQLNGPWTYFFNISHQMVAIYTAAIFMFTIASPTLSSGLYGIAVMNASIMAVENIREVSTETSFANFCSLLMFFQIMIRK